MKKKTKTFFSQATGWISWFLGSWLAVVFHTLWFAVWLVLDFDLNLLTFSVSLEAIFIGINSRYRLFIFGNNSFESEKFNFK